MIKHIVSFKLKTECKENVQIIKTSLENLPSKIVEIKEFEVGINLSTSPAAYDMVLVSAFESLNDLEIYRKHPEHVKVLKLIAENKQESMVVDYQI